MGAGRREGAWSPSVVPSVVLTKAAGARGSGAVGGAFLSLVVGRVVNTLWREVIVLVAMFLLVVVGPVSAAGLDGQTNLVEV